MANTVEDRLRHLESTLAIQQLEHDEEIRKLKRNYKKLARRLPKSNYRRCFTLKNLIIILPCLVGCFYQSYQITEVYLNYDVIAESLFYPGDVIIPPMVTMCIRDNFKKNCSANDCQLNSTTFFDSIYSFEDSLYEFGHSLPGETGFYARKSLLNYSRDFVTTYYIDGDVCYAIDFARLYHKNFTFLDARSNPLFLVLRVIAEACRHGTKCHVYVTRVGNLNIKMATGKLVKFGTYTALSYQKQELNLLPLPYTTKCFNYAPLEIHSQEECIAYHERRNMKQMNQSSMKTFIPVIIGEDVRFEDRFQYDNPSQLSLSQCTRSPCRIEQFYVTDNTQTSREGNTTDISLVFPENGELIVNYKPKLTLWEFLSLFGSVFSLWIGFNGIELANLVATATYYIYVFLFK